MPIITLCFCVDYNTNLDGKKAAVLNPSQSLNFDVPHKVWNQTQGLAFRSADLLGL